MKKLIYLWMALALLTTSCGDDSTPEASFRSVHLVSDYFLPDTFESATYGKTFDGAYYLYFRVNGERVSSGESSVGVPRHELFDSISNLYHDDHWNGWNDCETFVCAFPVTSISLVADVDYGEDMPAGCNLCDYLKVYVSSWGEFVLNNYPNDMEHLQHVEKLFSDFTEKEKSLWSNGSIEIILPQSVPLMPHNVTFTISFEGGKTLTKMLRVEL